MASRIAGWDGVIATLVVLLVASSTRLLELGAWMHPVHFFEGVPIMPSTDAFAWLAGATGSGRMSDWPLAELIRWLASISGLPHGMVAFWLPLVLAPIPGVLVLLYCLSRGPVLAAVSAGIMTSCSLGFLARTRLGYADTDLVALALPLAVALCWANATKHMVCFPSGDSARQALPWLLGSACLVGLSQFLYPSAYILMLAIVFSGAAYLTAASGKKGLGVSLWVALGLLASAHFGPSGLALGLLLVVLPMYRPAWFGIGGACLAFLGMLAAVLAWEPEFLEQTLRRLVAYSGIGPAPPPISDWLLPRVDDSIAETGGVGPREFSQRVGTHWSFLLGGLAGYGLVIFRWPQTVTLLPLLLLGLASFWLGHRFAMFAAPVIGIGLGLGLAVLLDWSGWPRRVTVLLQAGMAALLVTVLLWHARDMRPEPALEKGHAKVLVELSEQQHRQGRIWTWWDFGYAAQYYGQLPTLADGGNASRQRIFMLGQVFGANQPQQAAGLMRLAATERLADIEIADSWREASYDTRPLQSLAGQSAIEVQALLDRLGTESQAWPDDRPDEFLVVTWQSLRRVQWIDHFGRWRLDDGAQGYGQIMTLRPPVELDEQRGMLRTPDGSVALAGIDILEAEGRHHRSWPHAGGAYAVVNNDNGEGVLMDEQLYRTMAVQMLIGDPQLFEADFELVANHFPSARAYRLR